MDTNVEMSALYTNDERRHLRYDDRIFAIKASRRFFLGLVFYTLSSAVFLFLAGFLLAKFSPELYITFYQSELLTLILNSASMYIVGTSVLYLCIRKTPIKVRKEKTKIPIEDIIILFFIGQFLTICGNLIGQAVTFIISALTGSDNTANVTDVFTNMPLWFIFALVVVIGPIFEELVFRKLMIDRLGVYGDRLAIIISAISFGLFHGNFTQFFYTAAVGLIWGYVYAKSGRMRYSVIMHMLMNFIGGFLPIYILSGSNLFAALGGLGLVIIQYGSAIAGLVFFIISIVKKWFRLKTEPQIYIPKHKVLGVFIFNLGSVLFILLMAFEFVTFHVPDLLLMIGI